METTKEQNEPKKKLFLKKKVKAGKTSTLNQDGEIEYNDEIVKIGEKVKFWEEQERLNRELIPRVMKNNEHIKLLTSCLSVVSNDVQEAKIQILNVINKDIEILRSEVKYNTANLESIIQKTKEFEDKLSEINSVDFLNCINNIVSEVENLKIEYTKKFDNYETNLINFEEQIASIVTNIKVRNNYKLQNITIVLSLTAIILALGSIIIN